MNNMDWSSTCVSFAIVKTTVSQNVAHYNFNTHQQILVIFGRDVAERL